MDIFTLLLIAAGLAMDAFAVALCKGLTMKKLVIKHAVVIAVFFGVFQAIMPVIGWFLGKQFEAYITAFDHWIAFVLLLFLGVKMIFEALKDEDADVLSAYKLDVKELIVLSLATSIDALAVGITFAFLKTDIVFAVSIIGIITFMISFLGVFLGNKFGIRYKKKAEIAGGIALVFIGLKILFEHLEIF